MAGGEKVKAVLSQESRAFSKSGASCRTTKTRTCSRNARAQEAKISTLGAVSVSTEEVQVRTLGCIVALAAAIFMTTSAADAAPSAVARACAKDIKSLCADVKPGGGKLKACVTEHYRDLSEY